ncbi:ferritin family protein [Thermococcus sp.]
MQSPGEYLKKIVQSLKDKSPKEVLSYAIFNEDEEAKYYLELASKVERESIRLLFIKMSEDSEKHKNWLYTIFKKLYPDEEPTKIDAPPVEVAPFHTEFESVGGYLEALKYCMQSELFARKTYEMLAKKAENDESKEIFAQLAVMEQDHYDALKKAYDLMTSLREKEIELKNLKPGGYLFTDRFKARYFLADIIGKGKSEAIIFTRDAPDATIKFFRENKVRVIWISTTATRNSINPAGFSKAREQIRVFFETGMEGAAVLIEDIGYLLLELEFKKLMDALTYMRDYALLNGAYLLIVATGELFERREWALLTSEFKLIS